MHRFLKSVSGAAMISGSIIAAAAILGAAQAATDTIFKYSTPKVGTFGIDGMAMAPDGDHSLAYFNSWDFDGLAPRPGESGCFNAGVHLPNGATITKLTVYYRSGTTDTAPQAFLIRRPYTGEAHDIVGSLTLPDSAARKAASVPLDSQQVVVNNNQYSYGFGICLKASTDVFYQARVTYTYTNAGD